MTEAVGQLIDSLGVKGTLAEGDLCTDAIVLMKVIDPDGDARLSVVWSDGMSWIERVGMLRIAEKIELSSACGGDED